MCADNRQVDPHPAHPHTTGTNSLHPSVPHLPLLKRECYSQIQTYSSCLGSASQDKLSDEQTQERCSAKLSELWGCCERVFAMADGEGKKGV